MVKNHTVIIGGGGGIGRALVKEIDNTDHKITLISRSKENHAGLNVNSLEGDARDIDALCHLVKECSSETPITGMVCLAGSIILKPAHLTSSQEWIDTINVNLTTAFASVKAATQNIKSGGSIVLVSTVAARTGLSNHEAISAAKAGVEGLMRSTAATYSSRKIRCNCIAPGLVDTPLAERITKSERALEHSKKMHPLGRIGTPKDIASAIEWLLSERSSWITGQVIGIDGGLGSTRANS